MKSVHFGLLNYCKIFLTIHKKYIMKYKNPTVTRFGDKRHFSEEKYLCHFFFFSRRAVVLKIYPLKNTHRRLHISPLPSPKLRASIFFFSAA